MTGHVGIVGLGIMGSAYAGNLIKGGVTVSGCDPLPEARDRLRGLGGAAYETTGDWLRSCDLVIVSLLSPAIMTSVATELAALLGPGQIVMDTGTFALKDKFHAKSLYDGAGVALLDCPVSGTGAQAAKGDLVMMMSGDKAAVETAMGFTPNFTKKTIYAGAFGKGSELKFVANHAVAVHNTAAAETLSYADALGLDRQMVFDMLSSGAGQSKMSDLRMPLMIDKAYDPAAASLKMFEKDISVIGEDIKRLGLTTPLFDVCDALYSEAMEILPPTYDTASVFEVYRAKVRK